jgi:hypothetical protein
MIVPDVQVKASMTLNFPPWPPSPSTRALLARAQKLYAEIGWSAVGASSCAASGGTAGDGWSGTVSASGNQLIQESAAGAITYITSISGRFEMASKVIHSPSAYRLRSPLALSGAFSFDRIPEEQTETRPGE